MKRTLIGKADDDGVFHVHSGNHNHSHNGAQTFSWMGMEEEVEVLLERTFGASGSGSCDPRLKIEDLISATKSI